MKTNPREAVSALASPTFIRRLSLCFLLSLVAAGSSLRAETVVWQDNFDDAGANDRWYAENGVWQIGSPSVGPRAAHTPSSCAATSLSANYLSGQDSRFIRIVSFSVPDTNQFPRLRFWHWFSFAGSAGYPYYDDGSYGYVEIKASGGNWTRVSPTYVNSGSGVWSRPSLDLTPYAGQSVQVAFHFHSTHNTDVGWFVDDVALVTDTPVFNTPDSFESGMGDWSAESGTWQVGTPTSGPGRAYTGTACAATVLAGTYASSVESRFISPIFTVPAAGNYPRLHFWHWFSFAGSAGYPYYDDGSYGYVEIKAAGANWKQVSPTYVNSGSGVWTQPSIDLSPYAGQIVQVAFHFHSTHNTDVGWYVDDVALVTGPPVLNSPEGFESGMGDWSAELGTWQVGPPTSGPGKAHTGTFCAATVLAGNYASSVESRLVSPAFVVPPAATSPALRFWHWYSFAGSAGYPYYDDGSCGYVEIMVGTNEWQSVSSRYVGQSGTWTQTYFDLTGYAGQTIRVAFHFHSTHNTDVGWYVDDIRLVHDFTLLVGSTIVRTQVTACVPLQLAASSPASTVSFTLQATPGTVSNVTLNTTGCWANATIVPQSDSQWAITLQNSCHTVPMGVQTIGSLCFTAVSPHSAFVPLTVQNLLVTNLDGSQPIADAFGGRAVVIANEPLLESWLGTNDQRMLTLYGKANTTYEIRRAASVTTPSAWTPGWTNTVPASLSTSFPLTGSASNVPTLFLRADER